MSAESKSIPQPKPKICSVPRTILQNNNKPFKPMVVSLGPYSRTSTPDMNIYKQELLEQDLFNISDLIPQSIKAVENFYHNTKITTSYEVHEGDKVISNKNTEHIRDILCDAYFVYKVIVGYRNVHNNTDIPPFDNPHIYTQRSYVIRDILLLESQIPLKLISNFYSYRVGIDDDNENDQSAMIIGDVRNLINIMYPWKEVSSDYFNHGKAMNTTYQNIDFREVEHILDYMYKIATDGYSPYSKYSYIHSDAIRIANASILAKLGIKFGIEYSRITTFKFITRSSDGQKLIILPKVSLNYAAQDIIENLLVYEQCFKLGYRAMSQYVALMRCLVQTTHDVDILVKYGVIKLGDASKENIVEFWKHKCGRGLILTFSKEFEGEMIKINSFYHSPWNTFKIELKNKYFKSPLVAVSVTVAFLVTLSTLLSTIYGLLEYYRIYI